MHGMRLAFSNSRSKIEGWKRPSENGTGPWDLPHDPVQHPEPTLRTMERNRPGLNISVLEDISGRLADVALDEFLSLCRIPRTTQKNRVDRGPCDGNVPASAPPLFRHGILFDADMGSPLPRRLPDAPPQRPRASGCCQAQAGLPIASGPSLFVQPGIDLRHQDRTKGKFPG